MKTTIFLLAVLCLVCVSIAQIHQVGQGGQAGAGQGGQDGEDGQNGQGGEDGQNGQDDQDGADQDGQGGQDGQDDQGGQDAPVVPVVQQNPAGPAANISSMCDTNQSFIESLVNITLNRQSEDEVTERYITTIYKKLNECIKFSMEDINDGFDFDADADRTKCAAKCDAAFDAGRHRAFRFDHRDGLICGGICAAALARHFRAAAQAKYEQCVRNIRFDCKCNNTFNKTVNVLHYDFANFLSQHLLDDYIKITGISYYDVLLLNSSNIPSLDNLKLYNDDMKNKFCDCVSELREVFNIQTNDPEHPTPEELQQLKKAAQAYNKCMENKRFHCTCD